MSKTHWIFSGDNDDYDGYYINCSACGMQRKAYDRDGDLDIPNFCPHCGEKISHEDWEYNGMVPSAHYELKIHTVHMSYKKDGVAHPYIMTARAHDEQEAVDMVMAECRKLLHFDKSFDKNMTVIGVETE